MERYSKQYARIKICNMRKDKIKPTGVAQTFSEERKREQEKAIRHLEKLKSLEASQTRYRYKFPNGIIISASTKEGLEEMKSALEANK